MDCVFEPGRLRFLLVAADVRDLGAGVGHPRHHQVLMTRAAEEERVLDHHRGVRVGEVRELGQRRDVAGGEDPGVGGA